MFEDDAPIQVELRDIVVRRNDKAVVDGISFALPPGRTTVIIGPSGSGKSTLLKVAAGIVLPDAGEVRVGGRDLNSLPERDLMNLRRNNGFIFQDAALWSNNTIFQNLSLPLRYHFPTMSEREVSERVTALVRRVGYQDDLDLRPSQASTGERKIISFLRALVTDPKLIFMDEPLSGIDQRIAERMITMIRDLKRANRTILVVTHDPVLTSQVADYLLVMDAGRMLEAGPLAQVVRSTRSEVVSILSRVLSEAATFDGSILELLDQGGDM